jgi:uncharacterized protein involved in exopolysaccharide biosynthesis
MMDTQRLHNSKNAVHRKRHDLLSAIFRRRRLVASSFVVLFIALSAALIVQPELYKSEMKVLVNRGRMDPIVTTDSGTLPRVSGVTEQDLSSEIELMRSRDLLEQAVADCRLDVPKNGPLQYVFSPLKLNAAAPSEKPEPKAWQTAVLRLEQELQITPLRGSNMIAASYESDNPDQSACVLNALAKRYIDKHLAAHRPAGTFEFFKAEAERYRTELTNIQAQMMQGEPGQLMLAPDVEKEMAIRRLGDSSMSVIEKRAAVSEVEARIRALEQQARSVKDRQVTEIRTRQNPQVVELQSTLMSLRMKRAEMAEKYAPTYRIVVEIDNQIKQVEDAITLASRSPLTEEATNRDPEHEWIRLELAKARSELAALKTAIPNAASAAVAYRDRAARLQKQDILMQDLVRMAKVAEENYLLYLRKQEEARISDALDRQRIVNVAIAEQASVPLVPTRSRTPMRFGFAALLAGFVSIGLGLGADFTRRVIHTPADVTAILGVPTLASFPKVEQRTIAQQGVNRS